MHYDGRKLPYTREAPTFFEHNERKYLFTSGTTGFFPNRTTVCIFDDYHGEYTDLGDPCIGDTAGTTFSSQITCVLRVPGTDQYIACADRWKPWPWTNALAKTTLRSFERQFANYQPDLNPQTAGVSGKKTRYFEMTKYANYVWLPIEWQGEKPLIRWRDEWTV